MSTSPVARVSPSTAVKFSFHGVGLCVRSPDSGILEDAAHDFSLFLDAEAGADFTIEVHLESPPYRELPEMTSSTATPRNITYCKDGVTYIDYFGKALNIYNRDERSSKIYTGDRALAQEIVYLTVLSRISELLENKGLHRVHALGADFKGKGVLLLLPSGGGKSTLSMSLLQHPNPAVKILSEDSPLIDGRGMLHPFPVRFGLLPDKVPAGVDQKYFRETKRMEFGPKCTIDARAFGEKIAMRPVPARVLLFGARSTGSQCTITRASKLTALRHCMMNSVVGYGLYQGMEFIMGRSPWSIFRQTFRVVRRFLCNLRLLWSVKTYSIVLGRDLDLNRETLLRFLEQESAEV